MGSKVEVEVSVTVSWYLSFLCLCLCHAFVFSLSVPENIFYPFTLFRTLCQCRSQYFMQTVSRRSCPVKFSERTPPDIIYCVKKFSCVLHYLVIIPICATIFSEK